MSTCSEENTDSFEYASQALRDDYMYARAWSILLPLVVRLCSLQLCFWTVSEFELSLP